MADTELFLPAFYPSRRLEVGDKILVTRVHEDTGFYGGLALLLVGVGLAGKPDYVRRLGDRSTAPLRIDDSGRTPYALCGPTSALLISEGLHGCRRACS